MSMEKRTPPERTADDNKESSQQTPLARLIEERLDFQDPQKGDVLKIIANHCGGAERKVLESRGYEIVEIRKPEDIADQRIWRLINSAQRISQQGASIERDETLPLKVAFIMTPEVNDALMLDPDHGTALRRELGGHYSWTIRESELGTRQ